MADEGFQNEVVPLKKPDPADYPGAYDPKAEVQPDLEKPGSIPLPLPGAGTPELSSTDDIKNAIRGLTHQQKNGSIEDPWVRAKAQKFDAGMDGLQFERYYNHPSFKKLGFSPFRDNETLYNEESSAIQDAVRSWSQFGKVTGLGFKDAAGFGSLTDIGVAKDYEKAMAIGSSSRGGVSGFTTNLFMNSAYTVGIIGETMLEELGLALITGASGLTASEVTIPLMMARGLRAGNKIHKSYNVGKNILRTLDSLKDINKARGYFKKAVTGTGEFLNPLENSVEFMQGLSKADELKNLGDMAKTAHGFAAFYKDVRNVRLAWGESGLEGGMVRNDVSQDLLNAHVEKYGRAPSKEEADEISRIALEAGMSAGWQNIFAIYYSNKIVFDNLFKGFKPIAKFADDAIMDFGPSGKVLHKSGATKNAYVRAQKNWKTMVAAAKDPMTYGRTALGYFKANVAEGLQEITQEVISGAAHDAAVEEWKGSPLKGAYLAAVGDNLEKQISPEGLEVFMSGFLMGGMVQPVTRIPGVLTQGYQKFKDPTKYKEQKQKQDEYVNELVNKLNDLHNNAYSQLEPNLDHLARQDELAKGMDEAGNKGEGKTFYDLKDQSHFENVMMALKYGRIDSMIERLESLKELSPEEIKEEYGIEQEQFLKTLDKTIANTRRIEARYESGKKNMSNPVNPNQYKEGTAEYQQAVVDAYGWDKAYEQFLFLQESFDRNLDRKTSILGDIQEDTQMGNVPTAEFAPLYSIADTQAELKLLGDEVAVLKDATGDVAKKRKKLEKKRTLLKKYADTMEAYQKAITPEEGKELTADDKKYIRSTKAKVKRAYKSYAKHLATENKDHAFDNALDTSFEKMLDYYNLDGDTLALNNAVNAMLDPATFTRQAERLAESHELRAEQKQNELRESLDAYVKKLNGERLMQLLYDNKDKNGNARKRMFFDPEELDALINPPEGEPGKVPENFYYGDHETKDRIVAVPKNSKDFKEALDIIAEFVPNMMNIPISEEDLHDARNIYNSKARNKKKNDKRTYDDLAKQFGFDPKADESKVPLADVLDAIIKSKYATQDEQYLAKNLRSKVSPGETVTFTKTGTSPGSYSVVTQTVIDARYNSSEFRNGGLPIEHVILHEEIHRRTVEEYDTDPEFRKRIDELYEAARTHHKANALKDEASLYGLASPQEFIAEAMSNRRFQEYLAEIEYQSTGTPVWNKFVDAVLAVLKKTFGRDISNSVLNEAMYIITTKIDSRFVDRDQAGGTPIPEAGKDEAPAADIPKRTLDNTKITQAIEPVDLATEDFKPLADALVEEYRKVNADLIEDDKVPLDSEYANKDNAEILGSSQFKRFYKSKRAGVKKIFDKYNTDTGRTLEPLLEPISAQNMGVAIENALKEKGYTTADIAGMSVANAVQYANDPRNKAERLAGEAQDIAGEEEVRLRLRAKVRKTFEDKIAEAKDLGDLDRLYADGVDFMQSQRAHENAPNDFMVSGYTADDLQKIYNDKLKELEESFTFDDVVVGSVIQLKRGNAKMYITEKTDTKVVGHKPGDVTKVYSVNKSDFKNKVKYVVTSKSITDPGLGEVFTPEDQQHSTTTDENINNTDVEANLNDDEPQGPNPCN
jgi:hypothetical protein